MQAFLRFRAVLACGFAPVNVREIQSVNGDMSGVSRLMCCEAINWNRAA